MCPARLISEKKEKRAHPQRDRRYKTALEPVVRAAPKRKPRKVKAAAVSADRKWWNARVEEMERIHAERIELLRTVGEHPSPIFARQVRAAGALGMDKDLLAVVLGMTLAALENFYADDYKIGQSETITAISANMLRIATATDDNASAARVGMDTLARRGGNDWRPPAQKYEDVTPEQAPDDIVDTSNWTREERQQFRHLLEQQKEREQAEEGEVVEGETQQEQS
jgi:hypothetical protein